MRRSAERRFVANLAGWHASNARSLPWRSARDPWPVLVAEVLLQRSRGSSVAKVHAELFARWPDARSLSRATPDEIAEVIRPLGLTRRATTLQRLAVEVAVQGVPSDPEKLESLPGVGRYVAAATAAGAFGRQAACVDTVSERVYRRYFLGVRGATIEELWGLADRVVALGSLSARALNWAVLDLASTLCMPRIPRCSGCPLKADCAYRRMSEGAATVAG